MDILLKIVSLCGIVVFYGLLVVGVKKYQYHIKASIKCLTKKEMFLMIIMVGLLCLGILMQVARMPIRTGQGVVTESVFWIASIFFSGNVTAISFAIVIVAVIPAILYQVLFLDLLVTKCKTYHCPIYYFLILYVLDIGLYRNLTVCPSELLLFLAISAVLYYAMQILQNSFSKKMTLYLLCFLFAVVVLVYFEFPKQWELYAVSSVVMIECIVMTWLWGKAIILRKTLRRLGILILTLGIVLLNCYFL